MAASYLRQGMFRHVAAGVIREDVLAVAGEPLLGRPLLQGDMRGGRSVLGDSLDALRRRAAGELRALPPALRRPGAATAEPYPVMRSDRLVRLTAEVQGIDDAAALAQLRRPLAQHGAT